MTTNHPVRRVTRAAFFDLDKTILATSSSMALRSPCVSAGIISRREALIGVLIHLPYLIGGADEQRMEHMAEALGALTKGMDPHQLEDVATQSLRSSIDPVIYTQALEEIYARRNAGYAIVIASASVEQLVRPIARLLGADFVLASIADIDEDGRFAGTLSLYNQAEEKARSCERLAKRNGWEMSDCAAFSDSVSDVPLLEAVGEPHAVNPDRELRKIADERGWPILRFTDYAHMRPWWLRPTKNGKSIPSIRAAAIGVVGGVALTFALSQVVRSVRRGH
ncbi:HAD-IB family hydrolase [Schaalia sp. ZJ405]|uniref:HAD family hydrolase n=1 Tax=Schaalia sp. ZJ405 TaxID=2709403 RepID=UPI0013E9CC44|nr:HAD-IB family hydrolase [Schaalia sp. ZJ405]QPK81378.1 HAD-IB family hydrolase [Schaalia sp. ZJ405]